MKGVAKKQVNGLRDDNGKLHCTFYEMQDAIKAATANSCRWKTVRWISLHWLKVVRA